MAFLGRLSFVNEDVNDFISFYNRHLGFSLNGEDAGIGFCDEKSGRLVLNVGMAEIGPEAGKLVINIRYPVSNVAEDIYAGLKPVLDRYEIGLIQKRRKADGIYRCKRPARADAAVYLPRAQRRL